MLSYLHRWRKRVDILRVDFSYDGPDPKAPPQQQMHHIMKVEAAKLQRGIYVEEWLVIIGRKDIDFQIE